MILVRTGRHQEVIMGRGIGSFVQASVDLASWTRQLRAVCNMRWGLGVPCMLHAPSAFPAPRRQQP